MFYILNRAPIVTGQDLRSESISPASNFPGQYQVDFKLSTAAASRFGPHLNVFDSPFATMKLLRGPLLARKKASKRN